MDMLIQLLLVDDVTKQRYKTPEHNDDDRKDDYHRDIKPEIMASLSKSLKDRFGRNCDVAIHDGEIVIVSQVFDKDGHRRYRSVATGLRAEAFFDRVLGFAVRKASQILPGVIFNICFSQGEYTQSNLLVVRIRLSDNE